MKNSGKITVILMILYFVFVATTCNKEDENHHKTIGIINNSEKAIYTYLGTSYPDTLFDVGVPSSSEPSIYKVEPHEKNTTALWQNTSWEVLFRDGRLIPSDTLMIYIYDAELLESNTTHVNSTIIQRYDLSLQDLQQVNWILTYPPTKAMKDMKMYPAYKLESRFY